MIKHPDHENTFCECFGSCDLCEEYRAKHEGHVIFPATREVPKSTSIAFKSLELPGIGFGNLRALEKLDLRKILEDNSVKKE